MVPDPRLVPERRPSGPDGFAPNGRPRPLVRETWRRPGSAPLANPDRARSAPPVAAIARKIAFDTAALVAFAKRQAGLAPRGYPAAQPQPKVRTPAGKRRPCCATSPA